MSQQIPQADYDRLFGYSKTSKPTDHYNYIFGGLQKEDDKNALQEQRREQNQTSQEAVTFVPGYGLIPTSALSLFGSSDNTYVNGYGWAPTNALQQVRDTIGPIPIVVGPGHPQMELKVHSVGVTKPTFLFH